MVIEKGHHGPVGQAEFAVVDAAPQVEEGGVLQHLRGQLPADAAADVLDVLLILHVGKAHCDQDQPHPRRELFHRLFQPLDPAGVQSAEIDDLFTAGKVHGLFIAEGGQAGQPGQLVRITLCRAVLAAVENEGFHDSYPFKRASASET